MLATASECQPLVAGWRAFPRLYIRAKSAGMVQASVLVHGNRGGFETYPFAVDVAHTR